MFNLFPASSLDNSILTSVLVGLLVVWALQETLGWGFTALVVPGYMASILVIQPITGAVIAVEVVLTWLALIALSESVPRWWPWSPLFGRDRFFLVLLASVGIRLAIEGAAFPLLAEHGFLVAADLHSMGLVVVPLAAYAMWRTGLLSGLPRLVIPVAVTWAILQVLLARTNLSLSSFELTYEDLARDFVSSPRAYILLLVGAYLGSISNLRWGWDFGGIIVPGLLALCWLQPERVLATIGEVIVITVVMRSIVRLPGLRTANLTGGRPLVLAFAVAYLVKYAMAWTLGDAWPGLQVRQLFGFGYLLPAIMALRAVRSGDLARTLVPSVLVSLAGFIAGSVLGYALAVVLPANQPPDRPDAPELIDEPALVTLAAAWVNQGDPPTGLAQRVAGGEVGVVAGGDGFGGLWLREGGRPLVVTTRVGPVGLGEATLAIAEALDARAVLLCPPRGKACAEAREELADTLPLLRVELGPRTVLAAAGRLSEGVAPGRLGALLGTLALEPAGEDPRIAVLRIHQSDVIVAAANADGADPGPLVHPSSVPWQAQPEQLAASSDLRSLRLIQRAVVAPWMVWRAGGPVAEQALRLATGQAARLGLQLTRDGHLSALQAPDWRVLIDAAPSPAGESPPSATLVMVPFAEDEPNAFDLGLATWQLEPGGVLIADDPPTSIARGHSVQRPAHVALLQVLEQGSDPATSGVAPVVGRVVEIRGLRDSVDAGADALLVTGRPLPRAAARPDVAADLAARLQAAGFTVGWQDGQPQRMRLVDPDNALRNATNAALGPERHVTLFTTNHLRDRASPVDAESRLAEALAGAHLQVDRRPLDDIAASVDDQQPDAAWQAARRALADFAGSGDAADLRAALAAIQARGAQTSLWCEPVAGCRWLLAERCADGACGGLVMPLVRDATTDTLTGAPRDRLLLHGQDVVWQQTGATP